MADVLHFSFSFTLPHVDLHHRVIFLQTKENGVVDVIATHFFEAHLLCNKHSRRATCFKLVHRSTFELFRSQVSDSQHQQLENLSKLLKTQNRTKKEQTKSLIDCSFANQVPALHGFLQVVKNERDLLCTRTEHPNSFLPVSGVLHSPKKCTNSQWTVCKIQRHLITGARHLESSFASFATARSRAKHLYMLINTNPSEVCSVKL